MKPFLLLLTALPAFAMADVKVEKVDYHGWSGAYRVSNPDVDLVVVPQVGRIMRYGYVGKENILWENDAFAGKPPLKGLRTDYGGDRLLPAPQALWLGLPETDLESVPWTAEAIPNGVRLTSPTSAKIKVRFVREITMSPFGSGVHIRNRLENLGPRREIAPWQATQIDNPDQVVLPTEPSGQNPKGYRMLQGRFDPTLHTPKGPGLQIQRDPKDPVKIGAFSNSGQLAASKGGTVFYAKTKVYRALSYFDGSPLAIFTSPDPDKYAQFDLVGAAVRMDTGENVFLDVDWSLTSSK